MKTLIFFTLSLFLCAACSKTEILVTENETCEVAKTIVSVDEALTKLYDFLSDVDLKSTSSSQERVCSSVIPYYGENCITKSEDQEPIAYLINFKDEEGFAVLGANSEIAPIVAVVEKGNTNWDNIMSPKINPSDESFENSLAKDLLGSGTSPNILLSMCVKGALFGHGQDESIQTKSDYTTEILPLLADNYNYSQHRTYCHKNNNKFVSCGCCAVAVSTVMSYIKPTRLVVDTELLSYNNLNTKDGSGILYYFPDGRAVYINVADYFTNSSTIPNTLDNSQLLNLLTKIDSDIINDHGTPTVSNNIQFYRTRYKISSAIYYTLSNIVKKWTGTGTMPNALVNCLEDLRFTNVEKVKENYLTSTQINTIVDMLTANKPVLMCGWSLSSLSNSHYWVVDGIKKDNNETLIHCNWGWGGSSNGWFASDCIRSDSPVTKGDSNSDNEWNNILVFSYDKPSISPSTNFTTFYDEHRVTY